MATKEETVTLDRKAASRAKILAAARKLFVTNGYHDTRPQDIAREAGIGHGTFYLHFEDKRACFLAFVEEAAAEIQEIVSPQVEGMTSLEDVLRSVMLAVNKYSEENPGVLMTAMADTELIDPDLENHPDTLLDLWARSWGDSFVEFQDAGQIRADFDPLVLGYTIVGALHHASIGIRRTGKPDQLMMDVVIPFIVEGLRPK